MLEALGDDDDSELPARVDQKQSFWIVCNGRGVIPADFNEKVLCRSPYWRAQREWALALVDHRIVAVETGNMLGKGFLIGGLVPWFLWTRKHRSCLDICGAGQTQIGSVLFKEIRRAVQNCPFWKAGLLPMTISPGIKSSPATATIRPGWGGRRVFHVDH